MSTRRTLLTALLTTAISLPAFGQAATPAAPAATPAAAEATPPPAAPTVTVEGSKPAAPAVSRDKDTLSVDFPDEDIKTILRNVADLFELNLVVPETLTGKTSIKLRDVTWRQIFQVVLSPAGYTYVEEGNIIKIVSNELLQQEPGTTEVFILNNAKAADIKPTIDGLVDAATGGKIVIDARSNSLVITERPSRMARIRSIIEQLDKATDQVMIESKFVEVTDRDIRNIGINWASLQGMQFGVSKIAQTWNKNSDQTFNNQRQNNNGASTTTDNNTSHGTTNTSGNNTTNDANNGTNGTTTVTNSSNTTTGYSVNPTNLDLNNGSFGNATLNLPSGNITNLPATVPGNLSVNGFTPAVAAAGTTPATPATFTSPVTNSTTAGNTSSSGTSTSTNNGTSATTGSSVSDVLSNAVQNSVNSVVTNLANLVSTGDQGRLATAVFSASDFNIVVSALKTQNNTKIVSNPTIVTLNNTEATLNIGQEFPVPSYTYNSERGTFEVSGFNYKPIGIILKVTPQVNGRGVIKMMLEPEVSQQNGSTSFGGAGGASIPIIATRKVKTQVSLKDGYTMGIGGLITTSQDHGGTKVPVLGDIPLLGRLFSSKSVNDSVNNLLIFITAKTVSADGASPEEVFDPRAIAAVGMSREDLPGNRAPKGTSLFAEPEPAKKQ